MKKVYLDYAATSPVRKEVLDSMLNYFTNNFGNASSIHSFGRTAKGALETSRGVIAKYFNASSKEIIFTSGGTEADNLAIKGLITAVGGEQKAKGNLPHIIVSAIEHHAVLETVSDLKKMGLAEVTQIKPNSEGIVEVNEILKNIKENTVLVSIMYVNNEIGTVMPIAEIGEAIYEINNKRVEDNKKKIYFHTDAVQAVEYQDCDVNKLKVDLLSASAHKIGGPKGIGLLYIKKGTPMKEQNTGGAQEFGLRAGTESVPLIAGFAKAIELVNDKKEEKIKELTKKRDYLIDRVLNEIPNTRLNGSKTLRNPNNVNISYKYIEGESILLHLDLAGIAASSGSACTSRSLEPSHVLLAMGLVDFDAHGSIRFTLGDDTTFEDLDYTIEKLKPIVKKLREISPYA